MQFETEMQYAQGLYVQERDYFLTDLRWRQLFLSRYAQLTPVLLQTHFIAQLLFIGGRQVFSPTSQQITCL